jgi:hypothetical protein
MKFRNKIVPVWYTGIYRPILSSGQDFAQPGSDFPVQRTDVPKRSQAPRRNIILLGQTVEPGLTREERGKEKTFQSLSSLTETPSNL